MCDKIATEKNVKLCDLIFLNLKDKKEKIRERNHFHSSTCFSILHKFVSFFIHHHVTIPLCYYLSKKMYIYNQIFYQNTSFVHFLNNIPRLYLFSLLSISDTFSETMLYTVFSPLF